MFLKNRRNEKGIVTIAAVVVSVAVLSVVLHGSGMWSAIQLRHLGRSLAGVASFYAGEMGAVSAFIANQDNPNPLDSQMALNGYSNAYSTAGVNPGGGEGEGGSPTRTLAQTADIDPGTARIRNLLGLQQVVRNHTSVRNYCGQAQFTAKDGETSAEMCVSQSLCTGSMPLSCFSSDPVQQLFHSILGREGLESELEPLMQSMADGTRTLEEVEGALRSLPEYLDAAPTSCLDSNNANYLYTADDRNHAALEAENAIALVRVLLGRFPTEAEKRAYAQRLVGCPYGNPREPEPIATLAQQIRASAEFTDPAGNNSRLHAEPARELFLQMLGRDPALTENGFNETIAPARGLLSWLSLLSGQQEPIQSVVSVEPPFQYGAVPLSIWNPGGPTGGAGPAMTFEEMRSNPDLAPIAVPGLAEDPEYGDNGGGQTEMLIGLYRLLLGRPPEGPHPREDVGYYRSLMEDPLAAPYDYIVKMLRSTSEFGARGAGCACSTPPAPLCRLTAPQTRVRPGESIEITLHAFANSPVDIRNRVHLGAPPAAWDGTNGTLGSIYWDSNHTPAPGVTVITQTRRAGLGGTTIVENATVAGPGGSSSCSIVIEVESDMMTCNIYQQKRGPGSRSRWRFGRRPEDNPYPTGPHAIGGGSQRQHDFYYWWRVFIPARPASQFRWGRDFRYGSGYWYTGPNVHVRQGNYDPCNRASCNPSTTPYTEMPATYVHLGQTYRLMTRLSDGANVGYRDGGVCGSPDCRCYLSGVISPLLIDFGQKGIELKPGVRFDFGLGGKKSYFWPGKPDDLAFLVLDRNGDGVINDYQELFGHTTVGPDGEVSANGFIALAKYNLNKDSVIDKRDAVFKDLRLWFDRNRNGKTDPGELVDLESVGIVSIDLYYRDVDEPVDPFGNVIKQRSVVKTKSGKSIPIVDLWFAEGNPNDPAVMVSKKP